MIPFILGDSLPRELFEEKNRLYNLHINTTNIIACFPLIVVQCGAIDYLPVRLFTQGYLVYVTFYNSQEASQSWLQHLYHNLPRVFGHIPTTFHTVDCQPKHCVCNNGAIATFAFNILFQRACLCVPQGTFWECSNGALNNFSQHSIHGACCLSSWLSGTDEKLQHQFSYHLEAVHANLKATTHSQLAAIVISPPHKGQKFSFLIGSQRFLMLNKKSELMQMLAKLSQQFFLCWLIQTPCHKLTHDDATNCAQCNFHSILVCYLFQQLNTPHNL